jgi:TetR/AcrR family transcriptional repressor of nem operon
MPRDGERTKERILEAAQALVLRRGFAATSVDAIQADAGISRGTFFYHFPSKDDLARALIERYAEADRELVDRLMRRAETLATDPLQQALTFIALHEELFEDVSPEEAGCLFASYSYEAGVIDADTHRLITDSIDLWRRTLGGKLAEAMKGHEPLIPDVDPYLLADVAYGVLQGAIILRRSLDDPGLMARHVRQFRNYLELLFGVVGADRIGASTTPAAERAGP